MSAVQAGYVIKMAVKGGSLEIFAETIDAITQSGKVCYMYYNTPLVNFIFTLIA